MLLFAVMSRGQDIALTDNGDGTWALAAMPAFDVGLQVEYENGSDSIPAPVEEEILLAAGGDGTWTLASMPAFDAWLQVEYENDSDSIPAPVEEEILLAAGGDGTWTLASMPACDVILQVEYENDSIPGPGPVEDEILLMEGEDGTWVLDSMPAFDVLMEIEYEDIEIVAIDSETTVEPGSEAEPGKNVTTESGINISLDEDDTVDPEEGSVTMHSTYTTDELVSAMESAAPGSSDFADYFKGIYFMLAAGKGQVEIDIETFGNYMMSVIAGDKLIGNYVRTTKGTIVIEYDVEKYTWFLAYPSVTASSGIRRAMTSDTDGALKLYSIRIIPEEIYDPDGIDSPLGETRDGTVYNLSGQRVGRLQRGLYIVDGKKIIVK